MTNETTKAPTFIDLYTECFGMDKPYPKLAKDLFKADDNPADYLQRGQFVFYVSSFAAREAIPFVVLETPAKVTQNTQVLAMSLMTGSEMKIFAFQTMNGTNWAATNEFPDYYDDDAIAALVDCRTQAAPEDKKAKTVKRAEKPVEVPAENPVDAEPEAPKAKRGRPEKSVTPVEETGALEVASTEPDPFATSDTTGAEESPAGWSEVGPAEEPESEHATEPEPEPEPATAPAPTTDAVDKPKAKKEKGKKEEKPVVDPKWKSDRIKKLDTDIFDAAHAALKTLDATKTRDDFPSESYDHIANMGVRITSYAYHAAFRGKAAGANVKVDPTVELVKINLTRDLREVIACIDAAPESPKAWEKGVKILKLALDRAKMQQRHLKEEGMAEIVAKPEPLRDETGVRLVDPE